MKKALKFTILFLNLTGVFYLACIFYCQKSTKVEVSKDKAEAAQSPTGPFTWNNINNPHEELAVIENVIRSHIGWAVNNKDQKQLYSTLIANDELFFFQTDSKSTIEGIDAFKPLIDDFFMREDFKAIRTEINNLRINMSPSLQTAWFSCLLNDYNEFQGRPANWENVRWTGALEKVNGKWKIFQMHYSKAEDLVK